jgi:hypothetical protein
LVGGARYCLASPANPIWETVETVTYPWNGGAEPVAQPPDGPARIVNESEADSYPCKLGPDFVPN